MTASRIETYLPCEGPETHHKEKPSLFQQGIYSSLSTSRGAGNNSNNCYFGKSIFMYSYLSTSRGDGNLTPAIEITKVEPNIDTYLPREGSETRHRYLMGKRIHQYSSLSTSRGAGKFFSYKYGIFFKKTISPQERPETGKQIRPFQAYLRLYSYLSTSRGARYSSALSFSTFSL